MNLRLGFLASRGGSSMKSILNAIESGALSAQAKVLITNQPTAPALEVASGFNLPHYVINKGTLGSEHEVDKEICRVLLEHDVNLVVLSGYMRRIGPETLSQFDGRMLNIHPSLLPNYGGQGMYGDYVHAAVLSAGETESGATVHVINEEYDKGPVLGQARVPVYSTDDVESLRKRVANVEQTLFVDILQRVAAGDISLPLS